MDDDDVGEAPHPIPAEGRGAEVLGSDLSDYQAGCGRRLQITSRGWSRFDKAKRKTFLEWFAATCNAKEAARRADVAYSTVYRTRMLDARFAESWDAALEQGYARLEAKLLEMQFEQASGEAMAFDGGFEPKELHDECPHPSPRLPPSPAASRGEGLVDDAPDPRLVDPLMAMQLLRQHRGEVMKIRGARPVAVGGSPFAGGSERLASDAEVRRALVRGLKAFGVRLAAEDLNRGEPEQDS